MRTLISSTWRFEEDGVVVVEAGVSYAAGRYTIKPVSKGAFEFANQSPPNSCTRKVARLIEKAAAFCEGELKDPGAKKAEQAAEDKEAWMDETARRILNNRGADLPTASASIEDTEHLKGVPAAKHPQELKGPDGETLVKVAEIKGGRWQGPASPDNAVADAKPARHFGQGTEDSRGLEVGRTMDASPKTKEEELRGVKVDLRGGQPGQLAAKHYLEAKRLKIDPDEARAELYRRSEELRAKADELRNRALYSIPGARRNCVTGAEWVEEGREIFARHQAEKAAKAPEERAP